MLLQLLISFLFAEGHTSGFCALCALQNHVKTALQSAGKIVTPSDIVKNLRCILLSSLDELKIPMTIFYFAILQSSFYSISM